MTATTTTLLTTHPSGRLVPLVNVPATTDPAAPQLATVWHHHHRDGWGLVFTAPVSMPVALRYVQKHPKRLCVVTPCFAGTVTLTDAD